MRLHGLNKHYISKSNDKVEALKALNLDLRDPGIIAIVGESGSGKTTLLNCIGGFDTISSGEVMLNDIVLSRAKSDTMNRLRANTIGYLFQDDNLIDTLTVMENIRLPLDLKDTKEDDTAIGSLMEDLGIEELEDRYPGEISTGQRQRVALARTLIKNPRYILADEPTGSLDSKTGKIIMRYLKQLSETSTVIMVTHNETFARDYADRLISLEEGVIIKDEYLNSSNKNREIQSIPDSPDPKLPIKNQSKFALTNIKFRPTRTTWTIVLSFLALLVLSFSLTSTFYNENASYIKTLDNNEEAYFPAEKRSFYYDDSNSVFSAYTNISETNLLDLNNTFEEDFLFKLDTFNYDLTPFIQDTEVEPSHFDHYGFNGLVEISEQQRTDYGFDLVAGTLPKSNDGILEVALPLYMAERLAKFGLNDLTRNFDTPEALVGEVLPLEDREVLVVGILDTNLEEKKYESLKSMYGTGLLNEEEKTLVDQFDTIMDKGIHRVAFVHDGYYEQVHKVKTDKTKVLSGLDEYLHVYSQSFDDFTSIYNQFHNAKHSEVSITYSDQIDSSEYIILPLSQLPTSDYQSLIGDIATLTPTLVDQFADETFADIESEFGEGNSEADYAQYIKDTEENTYHPGKTYDYFYDQASEEVLGDYLNANELTVTLTHYTLMEETDRTLPVGGLFVDDLDENNKFIVSEPLYDNLKNQSEPSIDSVFVKTDVNEAKLVDLLSEEPAEKSYVYEPVDHYYQAFASLREPMDLLSTVFMYGSILFLVFTVILFYFNTHSRITSSTKDVGILSSLGVPRKDTVMIFLLEAVFIGFTAFVISSVFTLLALNRMNALFSENHLLSLKVYNLTTLSLFIPLLAAVLIPVIASVLPVRRLLKMKPVEILKSSRHT